MPQNLLKNGGFEEDWGLAKSHQCWIFPVGAAPYKAEVGNVFTPAGWTTWFRHKPGEWDQPEVRDAWKAVDPNRVHSGEKGILLFTFFRKHDAGFLQQVSVAPGTRLRLTAWAHAWSNQPLEGYEWCTDHGRCSCGVGKEAAFILEGEAPPLNNDPWNDAIGNFTFWVGIDPYGGLDPFAETVVWGRGAHIYNTYAQVPAVEAVAQSDQVTVFLRSRTMWAFKHNDAYWDDVELTVVEEGPVVTPPTVQMSYLPRELKGGEIVSIEVRASAGLSGLRLEVRQPSGAPLAVQPPVARRDGSWYVWTWKTAPITEAGTHTLAFSADGGVSASGAFECKPDVRMTRRPERPRVGETVTIEVRASALLASPSLDIRRAEGAGLAVGAVTARRDGTWYVWTWETAPLREAGSYTAVFSAASGATVSASLNVAPAERGLPREQYDRTYVLLPPDADLAWALAAIDSVWDRCRYTVGSSADDAGIGDLDHRRVIAINPEKWPSDLPAFFATYYPGVDYVAVRARTPSELKRKLKNL